ncbi:MAG: alpha/beta fold hydrolase [Actinobacteria bacterium]|nr:alpha/beta fold hydrolase [Actinomycetota bacterium]
MAAAPKPPESLVELVGRFDPDVFDAPGGRARVRLAVKGGAAWDAEIRGRAVKLRPADEERRADALIAADERGWQRVARDLAGGLDAHRGGRLTVRHNMHVGVGFLAATSGVTDEGRLRFSRVRTRLGQLATMEAGTGEPVVMLHGLGGTKISFLPTLAALAPDRRVIAVDLPGFGDSDKPLGRYDAAFFARWVESLFDKLGLERAHVLGHSMGGRVALELGIRRPDRIESLMLMTPSLAWRSDRRWVPYLRLVRPELGLFQPTPRSVVEAFVRRVIPGAEDTWAAAGIDEFLRAYLTPRGRVAFYAAARQIYLEEGDGPNGFWTRLESCSPRSLFLWGRRDQLVPIGFARHVERALPSAEHVELDCGHIPQFERPRQTHAAITAFLRRAPVHGERTRAGVGRGSLRRASSGRG